MTQPLFHIRVLCTLLILGLATALGVAPAMAAPAVQCNEIATAAPRHADRHADAAVHSHDIQKRCGESGCKTTHRNCCTPGCDVHFCCVGTIEASVGAFVTIQFTTARWRFPSEEAVAGLVPQGDPRPPRLIG